MSKRKPKGKLWDAEHPYYATEGCYFVGFPLGHQSSIHGYDGRVLQSFYDSWEDFEQGKDRPFTKEQLAIRAAHGIVETPADVLAKTSAMFGNEALHSMDMDLNFLYRWDWKVETDEDGDRLVQPEHHLHLYFVAQRKAYPFSATIKVTRKDEPKVRAWLWKRWIRMMQTWSPISGWPIGADDHEQALEHASCALATASQEAP